jgi:hypothetical protein
MNWKNVILYTSLFIIAIIIGYLICNEIREYHLQDDPMIYTLKEVLRPLLDFYGIKDLKLYKADKSFTINKERIFLCLYDETGNYYPLNMLIYVILHEIAHYLNKDDIGHTQKFHEKFEEVLNKATELGIYNPSIPIIKNYCNSE